MNRAALLTTGLLLLSSCTPEPKAPAPPVPPAPTPTYAVQFVGAIDDPNCQAGSTRTGIRYGVTPAQLQAAPAQEALLGVRCAVRASSLTEMSTDLVHVYRVTPAGLIAAVPEPLPERMDYFMQTPAGLALHQMERNRGHTEYVDPTGQRHTVPWQADLDLWRAWASNEIGIDSVDASGTVYGWHHSFKIDDQGRIGGSAWHIWTWRPGEAQRHVLSVPLTRGVTDPQYLGVRPGAPGSGERILLTTNGDHNGLRGRLQKADGTVLTEADVDPALRASTVNFEQWTARGYFVRYTRQINEAHVEQGQLLYRDGEFTDPGVTIEAMAADGDMIVYRESGRQLVRLSGETHDLSLPPGSDPLVLLPVGGGIVYAQQIIGRTSRLYRLIPVALQPTVNLILSGISPADSLSAEPLRPTGAGALLQDGGRLLRLNFELPATTGASVHTRTLSVTVRSTDGQPLAAGKTFVPSGTATDGGTGVTYTDISTTPMNVNVLYGAGGAITIDSLAGNQLKLSLRDVKLSGNKGQTVTFNGTLTYPEVVRP